MEKKKAHIVLDCCYEDFDKVDLHSEMSGPSAALLGMLSSALVDVYANVLSNGSFKPEGVVPCLMQIAEDAFSKANKKG